MITHMSMEPQPFGTMLKRLRRAARLTQEHLAQRAGYSVGYISMLERGVRPPLLATAEHLGSCLSLSEEEHQEFIDAATPPRPPGRRDVRQEDEKRRNAGEGFYGREQELATLEGWILERRCRLVAIRGIGGIGKTTLVTTLMHQIKRHFDETFFASLQNTPRLDVLLRQWLQRFANQGPIECSEYGDELIHLFIRYLQNTRCLIVLDNFESVLEERHRGGHYANGYEDYGKLLQRVGEVDHQGCLLLTSRVNPRGIAFAGGEKSVIRSFALKGLELMDGQQLLEDQGVFGSDQAFAHLVRAYAGNPLALRLISMYISELFGGDISSFLRQDKIVFGDIYDLLDQHFAPLQKAERDVLYWLAIEREETSLDTLNENMLFFVPKGTLLEALDVLLRRSLIERSGAALFTLQPVIMEYLTESLVKQVYQEIESGSFEVLKSHALLKVGTKDYVRNSQFQALLKPVTERLLTTYGSEKSEAKLKQMLAHLREIHPQQQGYAAGNILNLLIQMKSDLTGSDFSRLTIRQAYLEQVALRSVNFTSADLTTSVFTDSFGTILSVAFSPDGKLFAGGTSSGDIRLWQVGDGTPLSTYRGHTEWVRSVAFSPDGKVLASGSEDQTVRLWETGTGRCLRVFTGHTYRVWSVAFRPDGKVLASGSEDRTVRLWESETGRCLKVFQGEMHWVRSLAFSPDGKVVASGHEDRTIRVWNTDTGHVLRVLQGHTNRIWSVAFSPDGKWLTSGSEDRTVRIWEMNTEQCMILQGHTDPVRSVAFSPDGRVVASGSHDRTVRIWETSTGKCLRMLQDHTNRIWSVAFSPRGDVLASVSDDQTVRLWDVDTGWCLKTLQGYSNWVWAVAFHPDGKLLASSSDDQTVRLWETSTASCRRTLREHTNRIWSIAFSPDGKLLASGSEDQTVRLWETSTGRCFKTLQEHDDWIRSVAFSPDGKVLASGGDDRTIRLWEVSTSRCMRTLQGHGGRVRSVAFSPDGKVLASGSDDQSVRLWEVETGFSNILQKHTNTVWSVAFSPDGELLASGSDDQMVIVWEASTGRYLQTLPPCKDGIRSVAFSPDGKVLAYTCANEIYVWDINTERHLNILQGHTGRVRSIAFTASDSTLLASGSADETIKLWNIQTGENLRTLVSERPYEGMNITDIVGLTETQKATLRFLGAIEEIK